MGNPTVAELNARIAELEKRVRAVEEQLEITAREARSAHIQTMRIGGGDH